MKSTRTLFALLTILLLAPEAIVRAADSFVIENGKPRAEIVVAEQPARMTKLSAKELQGTLAKMSGATLPIVTERSPGKIAIYVGMSRFTKELGLSTRELRHGAFRMASGADWLALLGPDKDFVPIEPWGRKRDRNEAARVNTEWDKITGDTFWNTASELYQRYHSELDIWEMDHAGTFNAVNEFLRGLGCRWFAPGEIGEAFTLDPNHGIDGAQPKELFPWHFNLGRTRIRSGKIERTAFSPTGKDTLYVPEKFAKLWDR